MFGLFGLMFFSSGKAHAGWVCDSNLDGCWIPYVTCSLDDPGDYMHYCGALFTICVDASIWLSAPPSVSINQPFTVSGGLLGGVWSTPCNNPYSGFWSNVWYAPPGSGWIDLGQNGFNIPGSPIPGTMQVWVRSYGVGYGCSAQPQAWDIHDYVLYVSVVCTDTSWSPDPSTVCAGIPFTQTSNCGNTKQATGTKVCVPPPTCSFSFSPNTVNLNQSSTATFNIDWKGLSPSANNYMDCPEYKADVGASSFVYTPIWFTGPQSCTLYVHTASGQGSCSNTLQVSAASPTLSAFLFASPASGTVPPGVTSHLTTTISGTDTGPYTYSNQSCGGGTISNISGVSFDCAFNAIGTYTASVKVTTPANPTGVTTTTAPINISACNSSFSYSCTLQDGVCTGKCGTVPGTADCAKLDSCTGSPVSPAPPLSECRDNGFPSCNIPQTPCPACSSTSGTSWKETTP